MNKRGVSSAVLGIIVGLIFVLIAIAIIWVVVLGFISSDSESIISGKFTFLWKNFFYR